MVCDIKHSAETTQIVFEAKVLPLKPEHKNCKNSSINRDVPKEYVNRKAKWLFRLEINKSAGNERAAGVMDGSENNQVAFLESIGENLLESRSLYYDEGLFINQTGRFIERGMLCPFICKVCLSLPSN